MKRRGTWIRGLQRGWTARRIGALPLLIASFGCSSQASGPQAAPPAPISGASGAGTSVSPAGAAANGGAGSPLLAGSAEPSGGAGAMPPASVGAGSVSLPVGQSGAGGMLAAAGTAALAGGGAGAAGVGAAGNAESIAGASGSNEPATYPPLDGSAIGTPMQIASGFTLAESPLWDPCNHRLLFSDVNAAGGGAIDSLGADGKVSAFMTGTGNTNGMAWDIDGGLVLTQMAGHVARRSVSGMITTIDPPGSGLHTPDDVVVRSDGTIYFSDGDFCPIGNLLGYNTALPVYTIKPNTTMLINDGMVSGPNGIELSPDEKVLYVNGYGEGNIWTFDVMPDGTLNRRSTPFATGLSSPDSMCLDAAGNIYVAVGSGIQVFGPDGAKIKLIPVTSPAGSCLKAAPTNCTFGGEDGKTFYITTWTTLLKIDNMPIPGLDWIVGKKRAKCM